MYGAAEKDASFIGIVIVAIFALGMVFGGVLIWFLR
jgi:hypothetical protein